MEEKHGKVLFEYNQIHKIYSASYPDSPEYSDLFGNGTTIEMALKVLTNDIEKVEKDKEDFEAAVELIESKREKLAPKKFDTGKSRTDLIRPEVILALGEVLGYGADKYSEPIGETPNYLKGDGFQYSRIIGSLERHILKWKSGVTHDDESGIHHLAHTMANVMFLLTYELSEKGIDDRVILEKK